MKKILFSLVALVCSMSMNAQTIEIYKGETLVATYNANKADRVVFKEAQPEPTTGTAKRTGDIEVTWVQLWADGPKFAEYNVGAANNKAEDFGGYYAWGGSQDKVDDHNTGTEILTGNNDTATKLWGSAWRMPTKAEISALIANCETEWTTVNGVEGRKYTGKGNYASNSIFIPAAGFCNSSITFGQNTYGHYWTSEPYDTNGNSSYLYIRNNGNMLDNMGGMYGNSVRAVLAE